MWGGAGETGKPYTKEWNDHRLCFYDWNSIELSESSPEEGYETDNLVPMSLNFQIRQIQLTSLLWPPIWDTDIVGQFASN